MPKLTENEVANLLAQQPGWTLEAGSLVRHWTFPGFQEAMAFVNQVAALAEKADHHPDIDIRYNKVRLELVSHDENGITDRDARLIPKIDRCSQPPLLD